MGRHGYLTKKLPEGKYDPLISRELYNKVQEELHGKRRPVQKKRYYTYTNFIKYGVCGGNISGMKAKGITYYCCTKCIGLSYIPESELEKQITDTIEKMTTDKNFLKLALEKINKVNEKEIGNKDLILKK